MPCSQEDCTLRPRARSVFEDGLAGRNLHAELRSGELDDEAALDGGRDGRGEIFEMHALGRPRPSGGRERLEHGRRTATIEMRLIRRGANDGRHVDHAPLLLVDMEPDMSVAGQELVEEGGFASPPNRVMELPGPCERSQAGDHRDDRRYADPAGDQHGMCRRLDEREVIARPSDLDDACRRAARHAGNASRHDPPRLA